MRSNPTSLLVPVTRWALVVGLGLCLVWAAKTADRQSHAQYEGLRLTALGKSAIDRGDLDVGEEHLRSAVDLLRRQSRHPDWTAIAEAHLAFRFGSSGRLLEAERLMESALARLDEVGLTAETLLVLDNYSILDRARNRLAASERIERRALDFRRTHRLGGEGLADNIEGLGRVLGLGGDLAGSEELLLQSIELRRGFLPRSEKLAGAMHRLASVLTARGEPERARDVSLEGLRLARAVDPESFVVGRLLSQLGVIENDLKDYDRAEIYARRGAMIRQIHRPGPLTRLTELADLGSIAQERGDYDQALAIYEESLRLVEKMEPVGRRMNNALYRLGRVSRLRGDLDAAESYMRDSISRLTDREFSTSRFYYELAETLRLQGRHEEASDWFEDVLDETEKLVGQLGASLDVREDFRSERQAYYDGAMELKLEMGQVEEAFFVVERSRARSLMTLLAERRQRLPETQLQAEYESLAERYERVQLEIQQGAGAEGLLRERRALQQSRRELVEKMRREVAAVSSAEIGDPRSHREVRRALAPGAVGLYYATHRQNTWLFVLERGKPLEVLNLGIGEPELERAIEAIVTLAQATGVQSRPAVARSVGLARLSADLYDRLIAPVESRIAGATELVIFPDGAMHRLPFGALRRDAKETGVAPMYLVEWKPIHIALSGTLYAHLADRPRRAVDGGLVAFGVSETTVGAMVRGRSLEPLPHSRIEVDQIAAFYRDPQILIDGNASEEMGKSNLVAQASVIHFAGHTLLDPEFPLDSGLVLSGSEEESGILQAWEIMEQMSIEADLVVLSSCSSAIGEDRGGDGLVGLTSAFQSVGASSVVASLWGVSDRTTAELMTRFHSYLAQGWGSAQALRAAQLDFIGGAVTEGLEGTRLIASEPYHWAAFQLYGLPK